jgi:hypothetical protein
MTIRSTLRAASGSLSPLLKTENFLMYFPVLLWSLFQNPASQFPSSLLKDFLDFSI